MHGYGLTLVQEAAFVWGYVMIRRCRYLKEDWSFMLIARRASQRVMQLKVPAACEKWKIKKTLQFKKSECLWHVSSTITIHFHLLS